MPTARVPGHAPQSVDQRVEVVGKIQLQRLDDRRPVFAIQGDDQVDLVLTRVIGVVVVIVVVEVVVEP
jgi:hypothetical protein